ncbi:MAG: hypothetical protein NZM33_12400 [Bryobacteraceae bacterium]|nr:hypothetical protein [Bryobacteraceae bacterium]
MTLTRRAFCLASGAPALGLLAVAPPRRPRKDCFFGVHLDLHPNEEDRELGRDLSEAMVERFLEEVRPDFVQYDCKGHPGFLGYPSQVSRSATMVQDSLAIWRKVTARYGVALYIHFSGVWDSLAVREHPEWARRRPDGTPDDRQTSTFGPYVDARMIPQLKEAIGKYDLDGAWVDGDCWATYPDYRDEAAQAFRQATGLSALPKGPGEPGWLEFLEINREQFRRYLRRYVEAIHQFRPGFQIASNWFYSTYAPERPEVPVDFISGDYLGNASISAARLEARYLSQTGKPWDLMAWGFQAIGGPEGLHVHKSVDQLCQEAAVVLAQGGGFQVYYYPTRAGWLDHRLIRIMAQLAKFCRDRQALSWKSETVPQVGVIFSTTSLYRTAGKLFGSWGAAVHPARGMVDALVENHYSTDVIPEWKLSEVAARYPVIVVPDWPELGAAVRDTLLDYTRRGGKLLVAGAENAHLFAEALGVKLLGSPTQQTAYLPTEDTFANISGLWQAVEPFRAEVIESRHPACDTRRDAAAAATWTRFGSGEIVGFYGPLGKLFATTHAPAVRQIVHRLVRRLFTPIVELTGPPTVELVLRRQKDLLLLHLLNSTGMQVASDYAVVDFIPSVGPLRLRIRLPARPRAVRFEPGGHVLRGQWRDGIWSTEIPRLEIHGTVVVEV